MRKKVTLSFEAYNDTRTDLSEVTEITPEELLILEQDSNDFSENVADAESLIAAVEEACVDASTVETIANLTKDSIETNEGFSTSTAKVAEIAIESICVRLGIERTSKFSKESYGNDNRLATTKLALEESSNILIRIWEAIKKALIAIKNKIREILHRFFGGLESSKKYSKMLRAQIVEKFSGDVKPTETKLNNSRVASAFTVKKDLEANHVFNLYDNLSKKIPYIAKKIGDLFDALDSDLKSLENEDKLLVNINTYGSDIFKQLKDVDRNNTVKEYSREPAVLATFPDNNIEVSVKDSIYLFQLKPNNTRDFEEKLPVLSQNEMLSMLDQVDSLIKTADDLDSARVAIDKALDKGLSLIQLVITLIKIGNKKKDEMTDEDNISTLRLMVTLTSKFISALSVHACSGNLRTIKAGIAYVQDSLGQYN